MADRFDGPTPQNGFGKRGAVNVERKPRAVPGAEPEPDQSNSLSVPKWAIGLVVGLFFMVLVAGSGFGGGGFFGGLLGGWFASKMMANRSAPNVARVNPAAPAVDNRAVVRPADGDVRRGGFGTTTTSSSSRSWFSLGG